jgi:hypothetical protein
MVGAHTHIHLVEHPAAVNILIPHGSATGRAHDELTLSIKLAAPCLLHALCDIEQMPIERVQALVLFNRPTLFGGKTI